MINVKFTELCKSKNYENVIANYYKSWIIYYLQIYNIQLLIIYKWEKL